MEEPPLSVFSQFRYILKVARLVEINVVKKLTWIWH